MHFSNNIDLVSAILGGIIIGISSTGFLLASGKLTGISGFVENTISPAMRLDDKLWSISYVMGLMVAGIAAASVDRHRMGISDEVDFSYVVGGLLVGFGTRAGCGCTSGHGISGLPRFSLRALVAVMTFMMSAMLSAYCSRQMKNNGVFPEIGNKIPLPYWEPVYVVIFVPAIGYLAISLILRLLYDEIPGPHKPEDTGASTDSWMHHSKLYHSAVAFVSAIVFGIGLAISGMCSPEKVIQFLDFSGPDGWDPSLMGVMAGGVMFNTVSFHLLHKYEATVLVRNLDDDVPVTLNNVIKMWRHPANLHIDRGFVMGAVLFGLGWGLCGICPGPGFVNLGGSSRVSATFIPFLLLGMAVHEIKKMNLFQAIRNCLGSKGTDHSEELEKGLTSEDDTF